MSYQHKRLLHFAEPAKSKETGQPIAFLDDKFKGLTGGDNITCKDNYAKSGDLMSFPLPAIVVEANFMPKIPCVHKSVLLQARVSIQELPNTYVAQHEFDKLKADGRDMKNVRLRDNAVKERFRNDNLVRLSFMQLLLLAWNYYTENNKALIVSDCMREAKARYFKEEDMVQTWFNFFFKLHEDVEFKGDLSNGKKNERYCLNSDASYSGMFAKFKDYLYEDVGGRNKFPKKDFYIDMKAVAGERCKSNKRTRGVYMYKGKYYLQGYIRQDDKDEDDEDDEDEDEAEEDVSPTRIDDVYVYDMQKFNSTIDGGFLAAKSLGAEKIQVDDVDEEMQDVPVEKEDIIPPPVPPDCPLKSRALVKEPFTCNPPTNIPSPMGRGH